MPRLIKKVSSDRLREMLEKRVEQGSTHIEQMEDVLAEMDTPKARQKNIAAEGLIEDANHHLEEIREDSLVDPVLLASVQKIEHYCIAAWGTGRVDGKAAGPGQSRESNGACAQRGKALR